MSVSADLLPPSIRDERSLALAGLVDRLDDVDLTRLLVWRFAEVEASALPHLAAGFDAPLITRRPLTTEELRGRVAGATELHRLYGTPAGLCALARLVGAEVVAIEEAPRKQFLGAGPTADERAAFRALMPELRLYRFRTRGKALRKTFAGQCLADRFCHQSDAFTRLGRRGELVDRGQVTPLVTAELVEAERQAVIVETAEVRLPGVIGTRSAAGRCLAGLHLHASDAANRLYRVTTRADVVDTDHRLARRDITPSLEPLSVVPDQVAMSGAVGYAAVLGSRSRRMFPMFSTAGDRLYDRLWLHDPARRPAARRNGLRAWCGYGRMGLAPRTAIVRVEMAGRLMPPRQRHVGGFATGADQARVTRDLLVQALDLGRPAGSQMLFTTTTRRPVLAGQAMAGAIVAGATARVRSS